MLIGGVAVITLRNPVASALAVVTCFIGLAGLFIGLSAFFIGVIQILVYAGAVMVLFLFIIMLLDLKTEAKRAMPIAPILAGLVLGNVFIVQLISVLSRMLNIAAPPLDQAALANASSTLVNSGAIPATGKIATDLNAGSLPDVHLIGLTLFTDYNLPLQILGVLLLVATVGCVTLSKKTTQSD